MSSADEGVVEQNAEKISSQCWDYETEGVGDLFKNVGSVTQRGPVVHRLLTLVHRGLAPHRGVVL